MKRVPQIENGKSPLARLNLANVPVLPSDTPYGNLLSKSINIVRRIDRINLEVQRVYGTYVHPDDEDADNALQDVLAHQFYAEQVVYWVRKTSDELISLAYLLDYRRRTSTWPDALKIDSIAGILRRRKAEGETDDLFDLFASHIDFLRTLNDVSNAFKHSFINTDINLAGSQYPVVYAFALKRNRLSDQPQLYAVSFEDMVVGFSRFYQHVMKTASRWAEEGAASSK